MRSEAIRLLDRIQKEDRKKLPVNMRKQNSRQWMLGKAHITKPILEVYPDLTVTSTYQDLVHGLPATIRRYQTVRAYLRGGNPVESVLEHCPEDLRKYQREIYHGAGGSYYE